MIDNGLVRGSAMTAQGGPPRAPLSATGFAPDLAASHRLAALLLLALFANVGFREGSHFTLFQLKDQDLPLIVGGGLLLAALSVMRPRLGEPALAITPPRVAALFLALAGLLWAATHALMSDFGVSYDEVMVLFDMRVYAAGVLAQPLAPEWREFAVNLVPAFLLNQDAPGALVSAYLPMNALLRLGFAQIADPALMNPLLFAAGGVALYDIARRQFGGDKGAIVVALLLYALSMQALTAAMTPYAMTAHLALNMVWLAAFLRGGRWHLLAIAVGVVATGLHQLVFHPLFVAPFLLQRLLRGERRIVLGYALAYALVLCGWIAFPLSAAGLTGTTGVAGGGHSDFLHGRLLPLLLDRNPGTVPLMTLNMLRFLAWQHLALLPLVVAALPLLNERGNLTRPLLLGVALAILMPTLVLPYQGHGWGYRYLHGYIGCFALLGALGFGRLREIDLRRAWGMVAVGTLATLAAIGWLTWRIDAFVAPHVALDRHLARIDADMVIVETEPATWTSDGRWAANAIDLVRNAPDLSNRPLRLSSRAMTAEMALALCARGSIALVDRNQQKAIGFSLNQPNRSPRFDALSKVFAGEASKGRCRIVAVNN